MRGLANLVAAMCVLVCMQPASAHESRPLFVEIFEQTPNTFTVTWRTPPSADGVTSPVVVMPGICRPAAPPSGSQLVKRQHFRCDSDLSGERIRIEFPGYNPSISTLLQLQRLSGEKYTKILGPDEPIWRIPDSESTLSVAEEYLTLGIEHILKGYDHLLFVACLMFIAGTWRRVLVTVTGFTIAHSITLALAALNLVRVPTPPVEAVIALSIVFLAVEIARDRRDTITWRYPVAVAGSFGLLHGFGFASVLGEIGLPQVEVPAALLFFNVGVEIGQITFVALLFGVGAILSRLATQPTPGSRTYAATMPAHYVRYSSYVVGMLASYWLIERVVGFAA